MAAEQKRMSTDERRAAVLLAKAYHPRASARELARQFNVSPNTIIADLNATAHEVVNEAREVYIAITLSTYFEIVRAHLPRAVAGDTKSAQVCIQANKELANLLGLNATTKHALTVEIRRLIETLPPVPGLSVDDAVAEAERILAGIGSE